MLWFLIIIIVTLGVAMEINSFWGWLIVALMIFWFCVLKAFI